MTIKKGAKMTNRNDSMELTKFRDFLIEDLQDVEIAQAYLEECFNEYMEDGNLEIFLHCLKPLIQAQGSISDFAKKVGLNRTYLYKIFNNTIKPEFNTVMKIIKALGFEISFNVKNKSA